MPRPARGGDYHPAPPSRKYPVIEHPPKCPVTQDQIAYHLGQQLPLTLPAHQHYPDILYESVCNLVYKLAHTYQCSFPRSDIDDLAQDCWYRIVRKLHLYNPQYSFTTWCNHVCRSVLNKKYRKQSAKNSKLSRTSFDEVKQMIGKKDSKSASHAHDFWDAVERMKCKHPNRAHIIDAIFMDSTGAPNHDIVYRRAAEQCGESSSCVSYVFRTVIRPFFQQEY